jgi:PKD repeat protein
VGEVINFFPMSKNATQFTWYFGDSSIINGIANPEFFYQEPGDYEVIVKVSNSQGCEAFDTIFLTIYAPSSVSSFTIENAKVWSAGKQVFVANNSDDLKLNFQLYNLSGQLVATSVLESQNQSLDLAQLPTGLYVAQLTNSIGQKFTRKLSLQ